MLNSNVNQMQSKEIIIKNTEKERQRNRIKINGTKIK